MEQEPSDKELVVETRPIAAEAATPVRRIFLRWVAGAVGAVAGALVAVPLVGYFFGVRHRKVHWVSMGKISEFPVGETRMIMFDNPLRTPWDGMTSHTGVFARYDGRDQQQGDRFMVLAVNCAHLGCPVEWFPQSGLFMCPCHGGVYTSDGAHASGPPPRGLYHCVWRVRDGQLEIQAPHFPTLQDTLKDTREETV